MPRREYLYELRYVDMLMMERGYERRHRHLWSTTRWETYHLMCCQVGGDKLSEKGIHGPQDLIRLPWEREYTPITEEEVEELKKEIENFKF